jgi:hypothetical protein
MIFHCPHCRAQASAGSADCARCGRRMTRPCPSCSETVAVTAPACKYCGEELSALRVASKPAVPDVQFLDERPTPAAGVPWEDASRGLLSRWWGTWAAVSFSPSTFFSRPAKSGHRWPVGFAFGLTAQALTLVAFGLLVAGGITAAAGHDISDRVRWSSVALFTAAIPATFLATTLALYVASFLWHLLAKVLGGKGSFGDTLRVVSYAGSADAWLLIPWLGAAISPILRTVMHYHGFRQVHGFGRFRAFVVAIFPLLLIVGALVALACSGAFCGSKAGLWNGTC